MQLYGGYFGLRSTPCFGYTALTCCLVDYFATQVTATHLFVEVQTGALSSLAAHAARVGQLAKPRAVTESTLVAVAGASHAHSEHLHVSLGSRFFFFF